jgi:DNA polymerase-3 subunit gamma/tau
MSDSDNDIFAASGVEAPAAPAATEAKTPYRVLARKYRPQSFSQLIGQSAMVQTLGNAIKRDRLAHAFLMTGVRGVGKTSTARLIAKALNCIGPNGDGGPTIDPCGICEPCTAIAEGRHIDVIEMDAASNTGVDDVREIIEAVRYASVSARFKIYIIDEVHMLSKNAFNALLKTLEEPPPHVKFLFATTEVDKVPITVLSRCQRFDLKRIPQDLLAQHFTDICSKEQVEAEAEALAMIARAADGSVRDGLSVLDQAIAHADMEAEGAVPNVRALAVRDMLGLSDRAAVHSLLQHVLAGEDAAMLELLGRQHALGVEPLAQLRALMDLVHSLTLTKVQMASGKASSLEADDQKALQEVAAKVSHGNLHRLWQMLLKGHAETAAAPDPREAMDMAMLRLLYAASLPDPEKLARRIEQGASTSTGDVGNAPSANSSGAPMATAETAITNNDQHNNDQQAVPQQKPAPSVSQLADALDHAGELRLSQIMRDYVRVIHIADGVMDYELSRNIGEDYSSALRDALRRATGKNWQISEKPMGSGKATPSLLEQQEAAQRRQREEIMETPLVKALTQAFPGAELQDDNLADDNAARSATL